MEPRDWLVPFLIHSLHLDWEHKQTHGDTDEQMEREGEMQRDVTIY